MVLFLYGADEDAVRAKLAALLGAFEKKDPQRLNLQLFEGSVRVAEVRQVVQSPPFLASSRLVVMKQFLQEASSDQQGELLEWLQQGAVPDTTVLVMAEMGAPDKRKKLYKWLLVHAKVQEFGLPSGTGFVSFVLGIVQKEGGAMKQDVAAELISRVGEDPVRVRSEVQKLVLYAQSQGRSEIIHEDISVLVSPEIQDEVFALTDALAQRDRKVALRLLHRQLEKGASPQYLHSMFVFQVRNMLLVADGLQRGLTESSIAKEAGLHPFVVKKTANVAKKFSFLQLVSMHEALLRMDRRFKTSQGDPVLALDLFVTSVAA